MAEAWAWEQPTDAEQKAVAESLAGEHANKHRRRGINLAVAAAGQLEGGANLLSIRRTMCGAPTDFSPGPELQIAAEAWRKVQIRQAFRLALEVLLHWILRRLDPDPMTTSALVESFLVGAGNSISTFEWLMTAATDSAGPADWVDSLEKSLLQLDAR